ncbi:MAG TPA: RNA methyltransferase [Pyrinomonadaceae bacterium]|nr:RNA methyltransferase [Pyrinomonadaceae bacterium]
MIKLRQMNEFDKITSRDNGRLVNLRKVRHGKDAASIFIEGRRLTEEALRSPLVLDECFVSDAFDGEDLVNAVNARGATVYFVADRLFASISDTKTPQGILVTAKRPKSGNNLIEDNLASAGLPLVLFLKEINNPSNLGAVLRTAEAADIAGVAVSTNSTDAFSSKSIRASMGAVFRLPVWENVGFEEITKWAKANDLSTIASDISASVRYTEIDWTKPRLMIVGSEAHGLNVSELAGVDEKIVIQMENGVESLNLAVATGIILFEAKRQNG